MKKDYCLFALLAFLILLLTACSSGGRTESGDKKVSDYTQISQDEAMDDTEAQPAAEEEKRMMLKIGDRQVPVTWEDNASVEALTKLADRSPLTIQMSMYGGFEQVGPIGQTIDHDDADITTEAGDIVLYAGDQIVVFYGSNSWAYTRLGHIDLSQDELTDLLANGDVTLTLQK